MLAGALEDYLRHVSSVIDEHLNRPSVDHASRRILPLATAVRARFEECERHPTWQTLVDVCADVFREGDHRRRTRWQSAIGHWFRRAGVYSSILEGTRPGGAATAEALAAAVRVRQDRVTCLALLEGVHFAKEVMDFEAFQIIRPKEGDLEVLLDVSINRLFYPDATTSTYRLTNHWYLRYDTTDERPPLGHILVFDGMFAGPIRPSYSDFDPRLEEALKVLVLSSHLAQREKFHPNGWVGISIPFIIAASGNPFQSPLPAPPIAKLLYEPTVDRNGEEDGETPTTLIHLNQAETAEYEDCVRGFAAQLKSIRGASEEWQQFVDRGLGYLVKAYFADGIEQLIWHIVALEAFLGEERRIKEGVATRIAALYDKNCEMSKAASRDFKELYEMRCSYVHGRPFRRQTESDHLWRAREIAVAVAVRLVALMVKIARGAGVPGGHTTPRREDLLEILYAEGIRLQQPELARLLADETRE